MNFSKKMQQLFAILLVAVMVFSVLPAGTLSVFATVGEFAGGDGTAENPYLIASKTQLNNVRNYLDAHFKMIADIEFTEADFEEGGDFYNDGAGFAPIGASYESSFNGTFDGDGYVIKNLYVNITSSSSYVSAGLFGYNKGTIKNLGMVDGKVSAVLTAAECIIFAGSVVGYVIYGTIENCYNTGSVSAYSSYSSYISYYSYSSYYAGGIAGYSGGRIKNCNNTGSVSAEGDLSTHVDSSVCAGGIVGFQAYGTEENCYNTGSVSASTYYTEAFAGGIAGSGTGTIKNCYNTGSVSAYSSYYAYSGGIMGSNNSTINNSYNTGSVSSDGFYSSYSGGIAGINRESITSCYNAGNVSSSSSYSFAYSGGIMGVNKGKSITNCYNTGKVSATSKDNSPYVGGIVGANESTTITNCYNIGSMSATSTDRTCYIGGIAGSNSRTIENCYYLNNISQGVGNGTDTATKCTDEELKKQKTFKGFDFKTVWTMDSDSDYPYPKLKAGEDDLTAKFSGGDGTAENPYLIANKEQLDNVRNYLDANFKLIADIEFDDSDFEEDGDFYNYGAGFEPIGTDDSAPFTGTFDGDGYVIKNLYVNITSDSTDVYAGLFGYNNGTIKNLGIVDGSVSASSSYYSAYAGGIVGWNYKGTIQNCYNTGDVSASSFDAYAYAGGIAGDNFEGTIQNCYNTGSVSASSDYANAGGIAGYNKEGTIENCYNTGSVSASSSSDYSIVYAGGIAGHNSGTIQNCYNTGNVSASSSANANAGGIVGVNYGTITNCYYLDNISIGVNGSTDTATKCTDEQLKNQETFAGFDFETVWTIENNTNYPYPVLKDNPMILIGMGDINSDGKIDSTDYLLIKRVAFGTYTFTEAMTLAGDINGDVKIDSTDYLLVKRACFGTYKI